jgi:hypothetical protein
MHSLQKSFMLFASMKCLCPEAMCHLTLPSGYLPFPGGRGSAITMAEMDSGQREQSDFMRQSLQAVEKPDELCCF